MQFFPNVGFRPHRLTCCGHVRVQTSKMWQCGRQPAPPNVELWPARVPPRPLTTYQLPLTNYHLPLTTYQLLLPSMTALSDSRTPTRALTFYTLLITQTFSLVGSRMTAVALGIWVFTTTGQTTPLLLTAFFNE